MVAAAAAALTVANLFQLRIIAYAALGAFKRSELLLYASSVAVGMVGMVLGDRLARHIDQAMFRRFVLALMAACCALLFASAAGAAKS